MTEDIKVKFGADLSEIDKSFDKISKRKINIPLLSKVTDKFQSLGSVFKKNTPSSPSDTLSKTIGKSTGDSGGKTQSSFGKLLGKSFKTALTAVNRLNKVDFWWKWIKGSWNALLQNNKLLNTLGSIFSLAIGLISTALLLPIFKPLLGIVTDLLNKSVDFFNFMESLEGLSPKDIAIKISEKVNEIFDKFDWKGAGKTIADTVNGAVKFTSDILDSVDWSSAGEGIGTAIGTFLIEIDWTEVGKLIAKSIWSALKALWGVGVGIGSSLKDAYNKWKYPDGQKGSWTNISPDDPRITAKEMATGGIVTQPTYALVGEAGPEAVIPLDQMRGMSGTTINVSGIVDERKFREIIQSVVNQTMMRTNNVRGSAF